MNELNELQAIAEYLESPGTLLSENKSVAPPKWMQNNAKKGLKLRAEQPPSNRCCTPIGIARAKQISNGEQLSLATVRRMKSYASRAAPQITGNTNSKGYQAALLWGFEPEQLDKFIAWCDAQINALAK